MSEVTRGVDDALRHVATRKARKHVCFYCLRETTTLREVHSTILKKVVRVCQRCAGLFRGQTGGGMKRKSYKYPEKRMFEWR
jgi:hypothetical protein